MQHDARAAGIGAVALAVLASVLAIVGTATPSAAAISGSTAYTALTPTRILDTRSDAPGKLAAGQTITVAIETPTSGVPANATAVVFNLLALNAGPGFVTAYPADIARPTTSSLNVESTTQLVNNVVTVPLSASGAVKLYASVGTHLVVDVQGYFAPAASATGGRLTPVPPVRLLDTRSQSPGKLAAGAEIEVPIAQPGGFATDAIAAVLNVTVTEATRSGYWSVYPSGGEPTSSNLNPGTGQTVANQVITRLSGGKVQVFTSGGGHVIIDLVGWFTGASAATSEDGLFVPLTPARMLDTREGGVTKPTRNRTVQVPVAGRSGIPGAGVSAVLLNATTTQTTNAGYFTVWPAQTYRPLASNMNALRASQTLANHAVTAVTSGGFSVYTSAGGHLIADVAGWFTGTPQDTELPPAMPLIGPGGPPASSLFTLITPGPPPDRWESCRGPIRYKLNLGPYGDAYLPMVREALERVEATTGFTFTYVGRSTFWPQYSDPSPLPDSQINYLRTGSYDLLIALGNPSLSDFVNGFTVGLSYSYTSSNSFSGPYAISHSSIVVDMQAVGGAADFSPIGPGSVLQHELGHTMGLDHVPSAASQIMYPSIGGTDTYQLGDRNGLWRERAIGCILARQTATRSAPAEPLTRISVRA